LFDYGRMDVQEVIDRAIADRLRVLLISVLILPSALKVKEVCQGLRERGADIKVVVGGAPFLFDAALWQEVQADAMGSSAAEAVEIVERLMGAMQ
ncbi:MAG: cobalamin-dependent protein, partial [Rhodoferax sp.]